MHRRRWILELSLPAFRGSALVVRVCEASVRAAADKPGEALELADLALAIAEQVEGTEVWRSRVKGFALAHIADARRVSEKTSRDRAAPSPDIPAPSADRASPKLSPTGEYGSAKILGRMENFF
jgi:hypothetical protein